MSNAARAHWSWEEKHRLEVDRGLGVGRCYEERVSTQIQCSVQGFHKSVFTAKLSYFWVFPALLEQLSERMFLSLRLTTGTRKDWESSFLFCFEVSLCLTQGPCNCIYYLPDTGISVFLSINGLIITRCLCQALLREITLFGLSAARKSWRNLAVRKLRFFISFCTRFPKSTSHFLLTLCFLI